MSTNCPTCGRTLASERGMRVHHALVHDERLPNRECANCETRFYSEEERKYCSESCRVESVSFEGEANPNYRGGRETADCEICGEGFEYYPSEKPGLHCPSCVDSTNWRHRPDVSGANNPRWRGGKTELSCIVCDDSFERYPSDVTGEVALCSNECRASWLSETFTGTGHPNWRGGGNHSYGRGWNEVRERALERDDRTCVVCGTGADELGRNPDVHHIVPLRAFVESPVLMETDAHTIDNVVSLCPSCHRKAEFGHFSRAELRWRSKSA
ncbi:MAG: HNH endonuclease signature motif containing protein [Haloarculaceae archaeon]